MRSDSVPPYLRLSKGYHPQSDARSSKSAQSRGDIGQQHAIASAMTSGASSTCVLSRLPVALQRQPLPPTGEDSGRRSVDYTLPGNVGSTPRVNHLEIGLPSSPLTAIGRPLPRRLGIEGIAERAHRAESRSPRLYSGSRLEETPVALVAVVGPLLEVSASERGCPAVEFQDCAGLVGPCRDGRHPACSTIFRAVEFTPRGIYLVGGCQGSND